MSRDKMLEFEQITDDYINVIDTNGKLLGGLIKDSNGIWVYRPGRKVNMILTVLELEDLIIEIKELEAKTPRPTVV